MLEATELFSRGVGCAVAETQLKGHGGRSPIHKRSAGDGLNDRQPARNIDGEALAARRFFLSTIKIVLSLAAVALASAMTYGAARHSFAAADLVGISILALTVNVILLATAARLIRSRIIANAVMAGIVIAGLFTMHIVHTDIYRGAMATLIVLSCAAYVAVFVGLHAVDDHPWVGVVLTVMALVGIGVALFRPHFERLLALTIDQQEIQEITFEQRPNVYLVGFDGMTPAALLERFDVESTPFHDLMSSRFRVFRNFFTSNVMTMWAFNSLLALDENILNRYSRAIPYLRLFAGTHDAPLFRLFRSNGYEITTLFGDHYFGSRGGPYIDNYITMTPRWSAASSMSPFATFPSTGIAPSAPGLRSFWACVLSGRWAWHLRCLAINALSSTSCNVAGSNGPNLCLRTSIAQATRVCTSTCTTKTTWPLSALGTSQMSATRRTPHADLGSPRST